jgi:hypothetical protein
MIFLARYHVHQRRQVFRLPIVLHSLLVFLTGNRPQRPEPLLATAQDEPYPYKSHVPALHQVTVANMQGCQMPYDLDNAFTYRTACSARVYGFRLNESRCLVDKILHTWSTARRSVVVA